MSRKRLERPYSSPYNRSPADVLLRRERDEEEEDEEDEDNRKEEDDEDADEDEGYSE